MLGVFFGGFVFSAPVNYPAYFTRGRVSLTDHAARADRNLKQGDAGLPGVQFLFILGFFFSFGVLVFF